MVVTDKKNLQASHILFVWLTVKAQVQSIHLKYGKKVNNEHC
jgi:hypothetical protein